MSRLKRSYEYVGILKKCILPANAGYKGPECEFWNDGDWRPYGDWRISKPIAEENFERVAPFATIQKALCIRGIKDFLEVIRPKILRMTTVEAITEILYSIGLDWVWYSDADALIIMPPEPHMYGALRRLNRQLLEEEE